MTIWLIEPHDPLIVRDGRPFGPDPSARAISLSFPFPSTTTGGVRTREGLNAKGFFNRSKIEIEQLKKIKVRGPLLVQLAQNGDNIEQWLVRAPADTLLLESEGLQKKDSALCKRLVPLSLLKGAETDLGTNDGTSLMLVGQVQSDPRKPIKEVPHYWNWDTFETWLVDPSQYDGKTLSLATLGHSGPPHEHRLHVSMNPDTLTAKEGALFETSGLEFTSAGRDYETRLSGARRLALAVAVDQNQAPNIQAGLASLGGERRMVSWRKNDSDLPQCPPGLLTAIIKNKACRVLLLTPACFEQGYRPGWLFEQRHGVQPNLQAIAIQRPQVVSGWDLELRRPKATRRLAPAGTVLFLLLEGSDKAIEQWVKGIWMQCISDNDQDRNDGFGLTVLGSWSGQPEVMQEAE